MTVVYIAIGIVLVSVLWWWFVGRNVPKYPPLAIADDDPRMLAARDEASRTLGLFRELYERKPQEVQVKVPFQTNSGETEYLWAEVLSLSEQELEVRYYTPPVTHSGRLARLHTHSLSDVVDWAVFLESGEIYGGYTQRVMFEIAREEYGDLPAELEEQEARYVA